MQNQNLLKLPKKLSQKINTLNIDLENCSNEQKLTSDNLVKKENDLREIEKNQKSEEEMLSNFLPSITSSIHKILLLSQFFEVGKELLKSSIEEPSLIKDT